MADLMPLSIGSELSCVAVVLMPGVVRSCDREPISMGEYSSNSVLSIVE